MLDKNDKKYILRRIITYISIAMIMFFISSCQAHALTTGEFIPSGGLNISGLSAVKNLEINTFKNYGEGTVIFSFYMYADSGATPVVDTQIKTYNGSTYHTTQCAIGSYQSYYDSATQVVVVTATCPVNLDSNFYVRQIELTRTSNYGTLHVDFGSVIDFVSKDSSNVNVNVNQEQVVNAVNSNNQQLITKMQESNQAVIDSAHQDAQDIKDSLNDSTPPSSGEISNNTSDWNSNNAENGVINQLVLMPITLLNSFVNGINGSCSPYDVGELWGEHIIFPCIDLSQTLGSVWTIIDVILSGMFIFIFGSRCVKIFNDFTNLRSGQIDTLYGGEN